MIYPGITVLRCWAHKADHAKVKAGLHAVMNAANPCAAARRFAGHWEGVYSKAVACMSDDLDELLACFRYETIEERKTVRATNAIKRRFPDARRRTCPMSVFQDRTSVERILFAVFTHENLTQGVPTLFSLAQPY